MALLRTPAESERYRIYREQGGLNTCRLCTKDSLKTFTHWKILNNEFPYDRIAKIHHMILPLRHTDERGLTDEEKAELLDIKENYLNNEYEFILEATAKFKSIPGHFHLHLVVVKE